jgi:hypothetical protein
LSRASSFVSGSRWRGNIFPRRLPGRVSERPESLLV